jgi:hypothetical protein
MAREAGTTCVSGAGLMLLPSADTAELGRGTPGAAIGRGRQHGSVEPREGAVPRRALVPVVVATHGMRVAGEGRPLRSLHQAAGGPFPAFAALGCEPRRDVGIASGGAWYFVLAPALWEHHANPQRGEQVLRRLEEFFGLKRCNYPPDGLASSRNVNKCAATEHALDLWPLVRLILPLFRWQASQREPGPRSGGGARSRVSTLQPDALELVWLAQRHLGMRCLAAIDFCQVWQTGSS